MTRSRAGQSTLEYIIVFAAVVGALIAVATALRPKVRIAYDDLGDKMEKKVKAIDFKK